MSGCLVPGAAQEKHAHLVILCSRGFSTVSRGDLKRDSEELAYGLAHQLNLKPQSVACVFSPNSFYYREHQYSLLCSSDLHLLTSALITATTDLIVSAMQCAGLVVSGANAAYTPTELIHQLKDSAADTIFVHPSILQVALTSTAAAGWSPARQSKSIILCVLKSEAGLAGNDYMCIDQLMVRGKMLTPVTIANPKTTVAYLGYSSGTSGAAKGVRTSVFNMTSVLSILYPLDVNQHDTHIAVLPLNHIYGLAKLLHVRLNPSQLSRRWRI